ncbi:DUF4097 family beta strand repeat-containing protein [Actinomadura sp. 21ATH]|uniref:DUF4097 family beta strand repeat-containing protein n=1 Tax=Actinomadura sp. 21ATH TaxID=1735444 RepID=UPI0035BEE636
MRLHRTSAAAAALLLPLAACGGTGTGTVSDERTFPLEGTRLVIDAPSAELQVVAGNGPGVRVRRWLSGTAAEDGNSSWTLGGDTLRLRVDCSGLVLDCGHRFRVAVPPGAAAVVRSGDGNGTVTGLSAAVTIDNGSGDIAVRDVSGPLTVSTRSGDVTASGIRSRTVRATSGEGNVTVGFAAAPRLVDVASRTGNITARIPAAGHAYRISVTSGTGTVRSLVRSDGRSGDLVRLVSREGDVTVSPAP